MMTVQTKLGDDEFGGTTLFATEFIPAGTLVWKRVPIIDVKYSLDEVKAIPEEAMPFFTKYAYPLFDAGRNLIGYELNQDHGKFMNHDDDPNTRDETESTIVASRDIQAGEALTCDYRLFDVDGSIYELCPYISRPASLAAE